MQFKSSEIERSLCFVLILETASRPAPDVRRLIWHKHVRVEQYLGPEPQICRQAAKEFPYLVLFVLSDALFTHTHILCYSLDVWRKQKRRRGLRSGLVGKDRGRLYVLHTWLKIFWCKTFCVVINIPAWYHSNRLLKKQTTIVTTASKI